VVIIVGLTIPIIDAHQNARSFEDLLVKKALGFGGCWKARICAERRSSASSRIVHV
jgi:hypothetical protein